MGCASAVTIDLTGASSVLGTEPATLSLCVDGRCQESAWPLAADAVVLSKDQGTRPPVSTPSTVVLTARRSSGEYFSARAALALQRFAPNGEQCGPVCWSAQLRLVSGTLVTVAP